MKIQTGHERTDRITLWLSMSHRPAARGLQDVLFEYGDESIGHERKVHEAGGDACAGRDTWERRS
jgi:hypothetical protein